MRGKGGGVGGGRGDAALSCLREYLERYWMYSLTMRSWLWRSRVASGSEPRGASRAQVISMRPNTNHLLCSRPVSGGCRHRAISSWNGGSRTGSALAAAAAL